MATDHLARAAGRRTPVTGPTLATLADLGDLVASTRRRVEHRMYA